MNRSQIIDAISDELKLHKADVGKVLDAQDKLAVQALQGGYSFTIGKVGKLEPKHRPARTGRNPRTGDTLEIAASTTVKFKPSKDTLAQIA